MRLLKQVDQSNGSRDTNKLESTGGLKNEFHLYATKIIFSQLGIKEDVEIREQRLSPKKSQT